MSDSRRAVAKVLADADMRTPVLFVLTARVQWGIEL